MVANLPPCPGRAEAARWSRFQWTDHPSWAGSGCGQASADFAGKRDQVGQGTRLQGSLKTRAFPLSWMRFRRRFGLKAPISEQIADLIRKLIIAGDMNPGDRIREALVVTSRSHFDAADVSRPASQLVP